MFDLTRERALSKIPAMLAKLLGEPEYKATKILEKTDKSGPDLVLTVGNYTFVVKFRNSAAIAPLMLSQLDLLNYERYGGKDSIPLIVVPYMGETGQQDLEKSGDSWLDLSGNAHIKSDNLFIHIEGKPNKFKKVGRPSNPFAPISSRIARQLLIKHNLKFTQVQLARLTGLGEGFVSRIIRKLEEDKLIIRQNGFVSVLDPDSLLDAWHAAYDFNRHNILKGHIAARSGDGLFRKIAETLNENDIEYAGTGLGAAWLLTHFAGFRIATLYLRQMLNANIIEKLEFRDDPRGANTWIVIPNDEGVFLGGRESEGIRCVHPVQVYLDLKGHPERAKEAADMLRNECLTWREDD